MRFLDTAENTYTKSSITRGQSGANLVLVLTGSDNGKVKEPLTIGSLVLIRLGDENNPFDGTKDTLTPNANEVTGNDWVSYLRSTGDITATAGAATGTGDAVGDTLTGADRKREC